MHLNPQTEARNAACERFAELYTLDVRENPDAYKARVRDDPRASAYAIIGDLETRDVRRLTSDLRAERKAVKAVAHD